MKKMYQITTTGKRELEAELAELKSRRGAIADKLAEARDFGDLSENAEYSSARQEQERVESRIAEIENILLNVEIIKKTKGDNKVALGSMVTLKNHDIKKFQVVGTVEADPMNGKISDESPIGQALLGKKIGDTVEIKLAADIHTYKVMDVA